MGLRWTIGSFRHVWLCVVALVAACTGCGQQRCFECGITDEWARAAEKRRARDTWRKEARIAKLRDALAAGDDMDSARLISETVWQGDDVFLRELIRLLRDSCHRQSEQTLDWVSSALLGYPHKQTPLRLEALVLIAASRGDDALETLDSCEKTGLAATCATIRERAPKRASFCAQKLAATTCSQNCVTPFGTRLGANGGIVAYSNCSPACVDPTPHEVKKAKTGLGSDTYTGITWQCVEYARRWWLMSRGIVFGSVDTADDMWSEVSSAQHLASQTERTVSKHENGGVVAPGVGDLVIYKKNPNRTDLRYGHVAVVVEVDMADGFVSVAEQNFTNSSWQAPDAYSRRLPLRESDGRFSLYDNAAERKRASPVTELPIRGWLRVSENQSTSGPGGAR